MCLQSMLYSELRIVNHRILKIEEALVKKYSVSKTCVRVCVNFKSKSVKHLCEVV